MSKQVYKHVTVAISGLLLFLWAPSAFGQQQSAIYGYWEGVLAQPGATLKIKINFRPAKDGGVATIDIPQLYISQYPLTSLRYEQPKIVFELQLSRDPARFEGTLIREKISGTFSGRIYDTEVRSATFLLERQQKEKPVYKEEEVSFINGDVRLAATLLTPLKGTSHPAVVFLHGSGPQTRESYIRFFADLFARHGIATLIYDKRGTGKSTGEIWFRTGDRFNDLVGDALAGVEFLQNRRDIDSKSIGLWGLSQGAWLAPMAAVRSKEIAFLIAISGGGVTPAEQEIYDDEVKLQDMGFTPEQVAEATALLRMADDVIRKRVSWEQFAAIREQAQDKDWYPHLDRFPVKLPKEDPIWQGNSEQLDFDPRPLWEKLKIPVLAIFGEEDKSTPSRESAQRIQAALKKAGNTDYSLRIFPKADHALWVSRANIQQGWPQPTPGWLKIMTDWLLRQTGKRR